VLFRSAGFIPHHFRGELLGRVRVDGLDTATTPLAELVTHVGLVFQNPFNQISYAKLTLAEEVAFGLENLGVAREEMHHRVNTALDLVGLSGLAERSPYELSGGELQRVALASILVMEPRVLVLDEPTAQLDPIGTRQVLNVIRSIVSAHRCTVVMVEQKIEWVAAFADRVIALDAGEVVLDGTPRQVLTSERMDAIGVVVPRYTQVARAARKGGLWRGEVELPVTLEQALEGFSHHRLQMGGEGTGIQ
jgi:energy-coupling factor transport system ATP-binding protein